jgi:uncharacterized protein YprB with RNaseH-like and TPR domain
MIKKEIRCKHRHTVDEHPQCFMNGKLIDDAQWWKQVRTGYLDIETSGFDGDFDYIITWAIYDPVGGKTYSDVIKTEEILEGKFDKRIVKSLIQCMSQFDAVVTYYGTNFDIPFTRTRAYAHGLDFFNIGAIKHIDLYWVVRSKLKMSRNSLEKATKLFGIEGKNHVDMDIWRRAKVGNKKALEYVLDHNIRDVVILERLMDKLSTQSKFIKRSI